MTCIVGIADHNTVTIGGDAACVNDRDRLRVTVRTDPKVFRTANMLIGFTTSYRMGQLLRYQLTNPPHPNTIDDMHYLCGPWIDAVRTCFRTGGFTPNDNGDPRAGGSFLLGYRGHLYHIDEDFHVGEPADHYTAVGIGTEYALGSLHTTRTNPTHDRVHQALTAATHHCAGVAAPYTIITLALTGPNP